MRSYGQYCALAKALDVIGDRWTLLIVRELLIRGACRYTDLRNGLPGIATNLLAERLRELEEAGIDRPRGGAAAGRDRRSFRLTPRGAALEGGHGTDRTLGRAAAGGGSEERCVLRPLDRNAGPAFARSRAGSAADAHRTACRRRARDGRSREWVGAHALRRRRKSGRGDDRHAAPDECGSARRDRSGQSTCRRAALRGRCPGAVPRCSRAPSECPPTPNDQRRRSP